MMAESPRILVIEDEAQIRTFLRISLESEQYQVLLAENAQAGLRQASEHPLDLIILDLGLPDSDGQALISTLRQHSSVPIIVLSVRASEQEKIQALDNGANDFVTKPFSIGELMARVRSLLRHHNDAQTTATSSHVYQSAMLRADFDRREVWVDEKPVHLSKKEFDLLHQLLQRPGRILTHQYLLKQIWSEAFINETHYLRILVGHLRQKLQDDPMSPRFILTVQGVGYRFKDE